jgi:hypothetical protein
VVRVLTKILGREEEGPSAGHIRAPEPPDNTHGAQEQAACGRNVIKEQERQYKTEYRQAAGPPQRPRRVETPTPRPVLNTSWEEAGATLIQNAESAICGAGLDVEVVTLG